MLRSIRLPLFGALVAGVLLAGACGPEDSSDASGLNGLATDGLGVQADGGTGTDKVAVCHIPPGNPANAHTIVVGAPAVRAHLKHGDTLGACGGDGGTEPTPDAGTEPTPDAGTEPTPDAGTEPTPDAGPTCTPTAGACQSTSECCDGLTCGTNNTCTPVLD